MCKQNIISNKFDLNLSTTLSSYQDKFDTYTQHWPQDTQHNDTQHNDTQHNDTQYNDTKHNNTQDNDTHHNDTQYNDTHMKKALLTSLNRIYCCRYFGYTLLITILN